jgi:hypothetical protein
MKAIKRMYNVIAGWVVFLLIGPSRHYAIQSRNATKGLEEGIREGEKQ